MIFLKFSGPKKVKIELIILGGILFAGFVFRIWDLGGQSLWIDEGFTINSALSIQEKGVPILDSGMFYTNGILSSYMVAVMLILFDFDAFNPWAARLPSAFFGVGLIFVTWLFCKEVFKDRFHALFSAFLIGFSYWEIAWSRQARGYTMASFFLILCLYYLWKYLNDSSESQKLIFLSIFMFLLGLLSNSSILAILPFLIGSVLDKKFLKLRQSKLYSPHIFLILTLLAVGFLTPLGSNNLGEYFTLISQNFLFFLAGSLIALFIWFSTKQDKFKFILSASGYFLLCIALFSPYLQLRYIFPAYILLGILTIASIVYVLDRALLFGDNYKSRVISLIVIGVLLFPYLNFGLKSNFVLELGSPQPNFEDAFARILSMKKEGDVIVSGYPQFHKIYLNEKGLWLKMELNEKPEDLEKKIRNGVDYYVGAPIIAGHDALNKVITNNEGFLIMDKMMEERHRYLFSYLENNPKIERIFYDSGIKGSWIYLYSF